MKKMIMFVACLTSVWASCKEFALDVGLKPGSSVSVCVFTANNEGAEALVFQSAQKRYWFKGGSPNAKEEGAYRTSNGYCVYPNGKEEARKHPGQPVFPCGASGAVGDGTAAVSKGETLKEAGFREFEEETGINLAAYNLDCMGCVMQDNWKGKKSDFYVLYCRLKGRKEDVDAAKKSLREQLKANFEESRNLRDLLSSAQQNFDPEPAIQDDELSNFKWMDLRKNAELKTTCVRSQLAYAKLVEMDKGRQKKK